MGSRCISVGTRKGYSITNCDPFGRVYTMSALQVLLKCHSLFTHSQEQTMVLEESLKCSSVHP